MPQIFHKSLNPIGRMLLLGLPMLAGTTGIGLAAFYRSSYATGVSEMVPQPVAFSHKHHVGELGIDCRYCHTSVETSNFAGLPPTKICMNCHQQIWQGADLLEPVRESFRTGKPIVWNRVHNLPHYAFFNHSIHVAKGVGCASCHGQIDEMHQVFQSKTLLMEWCIACHRKPENHLRPKDEVFSMTYSPAKGGKWKADDFPHDGKLPDGHENPLIGQERPTSQSAIGEILKTQYNVRDATTMTNCSMCHR